MTLDMTPAEKNRERARMHAAKSRRENPERYAAIKRRAMAKQRLLYPERLKARYRRWNLKTFYGMTPADFDAKLISQEGGCAICKTTKPGGRGHFHVDHDHQTGAVRDLLCHNCNVALGNLKDDLIIVEAAARYLTRHKKPDPM